jgi:hypothetical protein
MAKEQDLDYYRSLSLAEQKVDLTKEDVSHYHTFLCDVCKRVVEEDETKGWNVGLYPADVNAWAIVGLVCSKACVQALVDRIEE